MRIQLGGERGIRTHGTLAGTPDFESGSFGHSDSSPSRKLQGRLGLVKLAAGRKPAPTVAVREGGGQRSPPARTGAPRNVPDMFQDF